MSGLSKTRVRLLTIKQRQLLIEHIDGEVPMIRSEAFQVATKFAMIRAGFLRCIPAAGPRPRGTTLTNFGREAVCMILGEYADALTKVGVLDLPDSIAALRKALFQAVPAETV